MSVVGNSGLNATMSPPKPQPMSAISTWRVMGGGLRADSLGSVDSALKAGKCADQSIESGFAGLCRWFVSRARSRSI